MHGLLFHSQYALGQLAKTIPMNFALPWSQNFQGCFPVGLYGNTLVSS